MCRNCEISRPCRGVSSGNVQRLAVANGRQTPTMIPIHTASSHITLRFIFASSCFEGGAFHSIRRLRQSEREFLFSVEVPGLIRAVPPVFLAETGAAGREPASPVARARHAWPSASKYGGSKCGVGEFSRRLQVTVVCLSLETVPGHRGASGLRQTIRWSSHRYPSDP